MTNSHLEWALVYVERLGWAPVPLWTVEECLSGGCPVTPCPGPGKHPRIKWRDLDSVTVDQVRDWWGRWPHAGIANLTGRRSGVDVIDVDPKNGGDLEALRQKYAGLPDVPTALTGRLDDGRRGNHLYVGWPGVDTSNGFAAEIGMPGVDYRGDGGLVVVPPTLHASGVAYEFTTSPPAVVDTPAWLADYAARRGREAAEAAERSAAIVRRLKDEPAGDPDDGNATTFGHHMVAKAKTRIAEAAARSGKTGGRHDTVIGQARMLGGLVPTGHVVESFARQQLLDAAAAVVDGEGRDGEMKDAVEWGLARGREKPWEPEERADYVTVLATPTALEPTASPDAVEDPDAPREYARTDVGNGLRFVDLNRDRARYVYAWRRWLVWDGQRWARDDGSTVEALAQDTSRAMLEEAAALTDADAREKLAKHALQTQYVSRLRALLEAARPHLSVYADKLDGYPWLLNTPDGTVDLRTGTERPHQPDELHTRLTRGSYRPDTPAPTWTAFLERVLPDAEIRAFVQRLAGAALAGEVREHVLPIHYGGGANGKSTFTEALMFALGDYAQPFSAQVLLDSKRDGAGPSPEVARLRGVRLAVAQEPDLGARLRESLVKQLTGGDTITARFLHENPVDFVPTHSLWLTTNHRPAVRGTDEGIWRRLILVPWTVHIPPAERDPDLPAKLEAEVDGVLAWAVEGCLTWLRDGLNPPDQVLAATDDYRAESDRLRGFLTDCCVTEEGAKETPSDLRDAYEKWCEDNAEEPVGKRPFYDMLTERGYPATKFGGTRWRSGVRLKRADDRKPDETPPLGDGGDTSGRTFSGLTRERGTQEKYPESPSTSVPSVPPSENGHTNYSDCPTCGRRHGAGGLCIDCRQQSEVSA